MWKEISNSLRMLLVMTVILGVIYPMLVTGFAQTFFYEQANGSLIYKDGKPIGSKLIGQNFKEDQYFHGRPSNAGENGYDATNSSGSNLAATSHELLQNMEERDDNIRRVNGLSVDEKVPSDLITASGSGLDPHITPQAATIQIERIAKARGVSIQTVEKLVEKNTEKVSLGFLGDARVNVLMLNLDLDSITE